MVPPGRWSVRVLGVLPPCLGVNVSFSDNVFLKFFRSQVSLSR